MVPEYSATMGSYPHLTPDLDSFQNIRPKRTLTLVMKVLGSALFLLMFVLAASPALSADLTLAWDPNGELDLEGYGVYFSKDEPGPPYELFGYVTKDELDDPGNPAFTVSGLEEGSRYYIALTAFDTTGAESTFSNPVCADVADTIAPCPSSTSGNGGGGGGGGATCFIGTAQGDSGHTDSWKSGLAVMAALAGTALRFFKPLFVFLRYPERKKLGRPDLSA